MKKAVGAIPALALTVALAAGGHTQPLRPFTVAEEIKVAGFPHARPVVSPDGRFVAIWAERGILDKDLVEDELRVYDITALTQFLLHPRQLRVLPPVMDLMESTYKEGPIISQVRWLPDSSGLAFLLRCAHGENQLSVIGLQQTRPRALSLQGQDVTAFDIRNSRDYVYTAFSAGPDLRQTDGYAKAAVDVTGRSLTNIILPQEELTNVKEGANTNGVRSVLWAAVGGAPHRVISRWSGQPIILYPVGRSLALSPDGRSLATNVPVRSVPGSWLRKFLPPYPKFFYRMRAGRQSIGGTLSAGVLVSEYALIDIRTGAVTSVNDAPTGIGNGWWGSYKAPDWSDDGEAVLLPNTYLQPGATGQTAGPPCVAIFLLHARKVQCLMHLTSPVTEKGSPAAGYSVIGQPSFVGHGSGKVIVPFLRSEVQVDAPKPKVFVRSPAGTWQGSIGKDQSKTDGKPVDLYVEQGLNQPPVVVGADPRIKALRVIWDPNPQLRQIGLGKATVYRWTDAAGHSWTGGLYKPANYVIGRRYPLVIQTHGFPEREFRASGMYPTAFAARALAASGIIVLQTPLCPVTLTPKEGACNVSGYEAAVERLSSQGIIDPDRVGIIGFSHTVYLVLEALTTSELRFAAASVTDGVNFGYWQYFAWADEFNDANEAAADSVVGGKPFGTSMGLWLKRSPEFNMQKIHTPLLVVGSGRHSVLGMWEPYAALRLLKRPTDLILLNDYPYQHILTNPRVRMASQGGSVDWFQFWLQGYESPHPVMAGEYRRWEKLCDMQIEQNPGLSTWCVPTKGFHRQHPKARVVEN